MTQNRDPKHNKQLSILIPARNEAKNLPVTLRTIIDVLDKERVPFEIIVINDHSKDTTAQVLKQISKTDPRVRSVDNEYLPGYGFAVRRGLEVYKGDAVVIVMADLSDDPHDIVRYYRLIRKGHECVFGTRFSRRSKVTGYPVHKLILNRLGNLFIQVLFWLPYNDISNAFKCYSRSAIDGMMPLISSHFNLTVEMPLKAIIRGYKWIVVPINWYGREKGISKFKIKEMGSRYMFIVIYLWLEKTLSRKDYHRSTLRLPQRG